ncbi:MAG TPA: BrnT family toxin [Allosphingosinicella sp.]|nr:BrnT family toxin [Allosphingosinicella sp.]
MAVDISFDRAKRRRNLAKHGLDLADAERLFAGIHIDQLDDRFDYGEERYVTAGLLGTDVVVCVWADWGEVRRIISLRRASADEQQSFFESFD